MIRLVCLLGLVAFAAAGDVLQLGDSDFADKIGDESLVLVKFYAPWCGHCKKIAPEYERAATALKSNDPPITLVEVDCTAEGKDTCSKYDIKGFPTLKAFKGGEMAFEYQGPRDADGIVKYMKSKAGPTSRVLGSVADAEKFMASNDNSIVGFFDSDSSEDSKQFLKLADALNEDHRFAHSTHKDVADKYGFNNEIVIFRPKILQNKFEDAHVKYDGDVSLYKMKTWVKNNIHGLCGHRTGANADQFGKPLIIAYYDVDYLKNVKGTNYWRNRVMKVAKKMVDEGRQVFFSVANKEELANELSDFGLENVGDKPIVAALDTNEKKFVMSGEFSMDNLEAFVNDMLDGKLKPYLKSEPIPEDNDAPVKVLVAENFDEIVNDEDKDVLIEFYAPWCGHCKTLAPKYDELAEMLAKESSVVIAKMDATANDVPSSYDVKGFPTLYYVPKGSKQSPKKYEGGREVDDLLKYLARESTDGLKGYDRKGKKSKAEL